MERGKKEFSDKRVTFFLIAAILISLTATWTVIISLNDADSKDPENTQINPPSGDSTGIISFTVSEVEKNGTG